MSIGWVLLIFIFLTVILTLMLKNAWKDNNALELELKEERKAYKQLNKTYQTLRRSYEELIKEMPVSSDSIDGAIDKLRSLTEK